MIKIWAKAMKDGRIKKQTVFEKEGHIVWGEMHEYLAAIAYELDIPTPVIIKAHIFNFAKFNHVKFTKSDFVDKFDYDSLFIENLSDR